MTAKKVYLDSETCGLHSFAVLLQYALDNGPIHLYDIWKEPAGRTLELIESFCEKTVVGFNLAFDWFHICKLYTTFSLLNRDHYPIDHIDEIAHLEKHAMDGPCVKPASAVDLMLWSRKGPYQGLMARDPVRIRRVPTALAYALAEELEGRIEIDNIYFAKTADKNAPKWRVYDIRRGDKIDPEFKDVVLSFNPAGGLKFLAEHALGKKPKHLYTDVEPPREWRPVELGYAPYALAISDQDRNWEVRDKDNPDKIKGYAWPGVIRDFIEFWATNANAREYAYDDIVYTRELDIHFGEPTPGDDDSTLACLVAACRWHGYKIDLRGIRTLLKSASDTIESSPVNVNKPSEVRKYLLEVLDDMEALPILESTKKARLVELLSLGVDPEGEDCTKCNMQGCDRCDGTGRMLPRKEQREWDGKPVGNHPVAHRACKLLEVKSAVKERELFQKLLKAGRFHASFNVIGTLSSRMSGGDGLNAQGIKGSDDIRSKFPLAWEGMILCGGDFDSFEVTLADAVYDDPALRRDLLSGKKIHGLFAMELFPGMTYEEVMSNKKLYGKGKSGVFAMTYGGDWSTLKKNLSIEEEVAKRAFDGWGRRYPGIGKARERTFDKFCSMRQPGGIGSQVIWKEPYDFVSSFPPPLGFNRHFTLENKICKALFELANKPPKAWRGLKIRVRRAKAGKLQTAAGAVSSALYGAAFGIQSANMRAAANHEIQSRGGIITKRVQRSIWDIQPAGVHPWRVAPMNVHDEIMCPTHPDFVEQVREKVRENVEYFRPQVPLIGMTWFEGMPDWSGKKGAGAPVKIRCAEMMEFD